GGGAGGALDQVEMEDEAVVMTVQRGLRSRLYHRGRYSPGKEQGVHHFHRLIGQGLRRELLEGFAPIRWSEPAATECFPSCPGPSAPARLRLATAWPGWKRPTG